jgi:6-phospho-beta-glucosidase
MNMTLTAKMQSKIVILGGSSPFTAELINSLLPFAHRLPACELILHGRDERNLRSVAYFCSLRLQVFGWKVGFTTALEDALSDAYIVIHQNRYGGLRGREHDEAISNRFSAPADETLGPGALHSILRILPELENIGHQIASICPQAWILNLTNPLSISTYILIQAGVRHCLGLCELPLYTVRLAADLLAINPDQLDWQYVGLNHRGFVTALKDDGRDRLYELPAVLGTQTINGITASQILDLRALPTKYFKIIADQDSHPSGSRATYLAQLRDQISLDLFNDPTVSPPLLSQRYMLWYPMSVVPMIIALHEKKPSMHMVNILTATGLVEEVQANVSKDSIDLLPAKADPGSVVNTFIRTFHAHEKSVISCIANPSLATIVAALDLDPVTPPGNHMQIAKAIWTSCFESKYS